MKIKHTPLDGLLIIEPSIFEDHRGFFIEMYQSDRYYEAGIRENFLQDNQSRSVKNVLRGMHFQVKHPQAQILTVLRGSIYDVCVDLRITSPTFKKWFGIELHDTGPRQVYMAPGFAHGFCVLSDWADLSYKTSRHYDANDEGGFSWNDSDIGIEWPILDPIISERDLNYLNLEDINHTYLPQIPPK